MEQILSDLTEQVRQDLLPGLRAEIRSELLAELDRDRERQVGHRLINTDTVCAKIGGISVNTLHVMRRSQNDFPKPKLINGRPHWRERDIDAWIDARPEAAY